MHIFVCILRESKLEPESFLPCIMLLSFTKDALLSHTDSVYYLKWVGWQLFIVKLRRHGCSKFIVKYY